MGSGFWVIDKGYPLFVGDTLSHVEEASKVKTKTFKQFQLEQLIKDGTAIPASKLVQAKDLTLNAAKTLRGPLGMRNVNARLQQPHQKTS